MALTRDFNKTVVTRVKKDPEFAKALLDEAATLFLNGELETAKFIFARSGQRHHWLRATRSIGREAFQERSPHALPIGKSDHDQPGRNLCCVETRGSWLVVRGSSFVGRGAWGVVRQHPPRRR